MKEIKVFISYSHDSEEHLQRVLEFSDRLRDDGVDCCFDQYVNGAPHEGWQRWMEQQIEAADFVLIVCTPCYLQRFRGVDREGGRGANFEGVIISQVLYDNFQKNTKFIPLIPDDGSLGDVPLMLKSGNTYKLGNEYEKLYRVLTNQPQFIAKPLGKLRHYPSTNSAPSAQLKQTDTAREKEGKRSQGTKKSGSVIQVILVIILSLVLIYGFAPGLWEKAESFYRKNLGWTEEAIRNNPVGYLKYAREKLQNDLSKLQNIIKDLEVQSIRMQRYADKLAEDQGKYEELLNRVKNLYNTAEANPQNGYPVKFAGASYAKDEFLTQIKILLNKNKNAKQQLVNLQNASERMRNALTEMHSKYARAKGALESIDTTIVIAKANEISAEVKTSMDQIAAVQQGIDVYLGNYESSVPIRSAEDVMKASSEGGGAVTDAELQKFLDS